MKIRILSFILLLISFYESQGQSLQGSQGTTLKDCISALQKRFNITFSYDSDLIKNVPVVLDTTGKDLDGILKSLSAKTAFDFERTKDNVVLLNPKHKGANFKICGKIFDNESKEFLEGGIITNESRTLSRATDANGEFLIYTDYVEGEIITIRYFGYKTFTIPIKSFVSGNCVETGMTSDVLDLDEVVLATYMSSGIQYNRLYNSIDVKPENLSLLPGQTDADLLLSLDALPGINSPDGKAGNLNVRGSSSDQTLITFDGVPIYHKGHYFGTLSPFNPKVVENLSVSRSSFTADKGGRIGGAIDIKTKQSVPDSMISGVSFSTIDAAAYTNIPIIDKKLSIMVAGRSAYPFNWQSPKIKAISDFVFQETDINRARSELGGYKINNLGYKFNDVNTKLIFKPNAKQKVTVSLLKIFNEMKVEIQNQEQRSVARDSLGFNNWGLSGQWESWWSDKTVSRLSVASSSYTQKTRHANEVSDTTRLLEDNVNSAKDMSLNFETDFYGKGKHFWKTGYNINYHDVMFRTTTIRMPQPPSVTENLNSGSIHSLYASYNLIFYKIHTSIGLRNNYFSVTDKVNVEPRITANYLINDAFKLKSSWGIQKQFVTQILGLTIENFGSVDNLMWVLADGKNVPVVKSNQIMTGAMFESKGWLIDLELYYKIINDLSVINIVQFNSPTTPYFYGKSHTVGGDLLVKKRWKKFDAWVSYTLSDSKMQFDSIQEKPFTSLINQRHVLDLDILYRLGKFKFSAGWKYRSGLASLPGIRTKLLHGAPPAGGPPPPPPGSAQTLTGNKEYTDHYPSFHQLDISVVYEFPTKRKQWNGNVGISLLNVYNRKNVIEQFRRPGQGPNVTFIANKYSMGFAPNVFISFNF